jgi:hypothetical protein
MADDLELALPDEATLLPLTYALTMGWVETTCPARLAPASEVEAMAGAAGRLALATPQAALCAPASVIVADVAVTSRFRGAQALASAVRPDELEVAEIDARDVSTTTETLLRILAAQHFGARGWAVTRAAAPGASARLLEGERALVALAEAEATLDQ